MEDLRTFEELEEAEMYTTVDHLAKDTMLILCNCRTHNADGFAYVKRYRYFLQIVVCLTKH